MTRSCFSSHESLTPPLNGEVFLWCPLVLGVLTHAQRHQTRTKSDAPADQQENLNLDAPVDPSEEPTETSAPAVDESSWVSDQLQQLQAELDDTLARLHELEQYTNVAPFCNYSVGTVRTCEVLTNQDGEPWAVKMPVRFSVGVNKNLLDTNIPEDAEADWCNAPVFPSGKDPFFIYKGEDLLELAGLINSTNWVTLGLQWKHCLLYTSPSPRDLSTSRMPSSA